MTLRSYIWGMLFLILLFAGILGAVVFFIDPDSSGFLGMFLFYSTFFFVFSGIFNLFLLFWRKKFLDEKSLANSVGLNFRQGILLAILFLGILIFQGLRILIWWDVLFLIAGVFLLEFFFLSREP
ncbi:MAG: hypothetical protein COZ85_00235 [Candidatus Moranbacteria bacterium CG_4_8_14_3_um_filter_34_16]|nr:MAG: hypothetical protein COT31_01010 [Candidatus Moranbacteria bacterium CG08_land_8_20_14_0_20_34_16]PIW95376.1 MAG: hypothetical protein COZ85_00235 [Candidatus Moranbacteria bacterium CG_4_8_14_3_um_filter_34_16]PJA89259.1 MAG: hypothetical protein CO138_01425 [Candidatus Moranbacteria bacterium CG_4_9_14_3_um_filter_33_15]